MKKKLGIVLLALIALVLVACGGEVSGKPQGEFSLRDNTDGERILVLQPGSSLEITKESFLEYPGGKLTLDPGAVITAKTVMTITLATGDTLGDFDVAYPDPLTPTVTVSPTVAPPATPVAEIKIADHPALQVPQLVGPFVDTDYPELWEDVGAPIVVTGTVVTQGDDWVEWKLEEADAWQKLTEAVDEYAEIPEGEGWLRVVNDVDDTYIVFLEQMPAAPPDPTATPAPPVTADATIVIDGVLVEVPHQIGPFVEGDYPGIFTGNGAKIEVTGTVIILADDQAWWRELGTDDWTVLTATVADYAPIPEGPGFLRVEDVYGVNRHFFLLERMP